VPLKEKDPDLITELDAPRDQRPLSFRPQSYHRRYDPDEHLFRSRDNNMSAPTLTPLTTYTLAHTAQCKLKLAADRPDRNLRFVLGHAFILDNLMLRICEIENETVKPSFEDKSKDVDDAADAHFDCTAAAVPAPATPAAPEPSVPAGRRVSFGDNDARPSNSGEHGAGISSPKRARSPPPTAVPSAFDYSEEQESDTSSDDYDEDMGMYDYSAAHPSKSVHLDGEADSEQVEGGEEEEEEEEELSLTRFESASAQPPRMIPDEDDEGEDTGPVSPPTLPADLDIKTVVSGEQDDELTDLYESVRKCVCHGERHSADKARSVWGVSAEKTGGHRIAVVEVEAARS